MASLKMPFSYFKEIVNFNSINGLAALKIIRLSLFSISFIFFLKSYDIIEVGYFNLNLSIVALTTTFISLGLKPLLTSIFSKFNNIIPNILIQIILIQVVLASITILPVLGYFIFFDLSSIIPLLFLLIIVAPIAGLDFIFEIEGIQRKYYIQYQYLNIFIIFFLRIFFIYSNFELNTFFLTYILEYFFSIIIIFKVLNLKFKNPMKKFHTAIIIIKSSFPVLVSSFVTIAIWRIDQFCLFVLADAKHVAVQGTLILAYDAIWIMIVTLLNNKFSVFIKKENFDSRRLLFNGTKIAVSFAPVFVVIIILLLFILGSEFSIGYWSAPIYGTVLIIHSYGFLLNRIFVFKKKSHWILINHIFLLVFNTLLNIVFIPEYGIQGSAIATLISMTSVYLVSTITFYKIIGM